MFYKYIYIYIHIKNKKTCNFILKFMLSIVILSNVLFILSKMCYIVFYNLKYTLIHSLTLIFDSFIKIILNNYSIKFVYQYNIIYILNFIFYICILKFSRVFFF